MHLYFLEEGGHNLVACGFGSIMVVSSRLVSASSWRSPPTVLARNKAAPADWPTDGRCTSTPAMGRRSPARGGAAPCTSARSIRRFHCAVELSSGAFG